MITTNARGSMFSENYSHLQQDIFGIESHLSESKRKKLHNSMEASFYKIIFCNIDEKLFAPLFSDTGSRPNASVNVLVSSLILYQKKGWTTEELFDRIDFDLRLRFALGLNNLDDTPFCPATFFNFQNRLLNYFTKTGINLLELVFDTLTQDQLKELKIKTDIQRMDSFQALSNIRSYSRTQLLVEMLIRLYRVLDEQDQKKYQEILSPYLSQTSSKFIYGLKKTDIPHELEKLAVIYHSLYNCLKSSYNSIEVFKIFERVYNEHFCVVSDTITVKDSKELGSSSLQSPDDIDATFRSKRGNNFQGQVVNITETANPENSLNLITDVAVAANNTDDSTILNDRIDEIKAKTPDLNELHTDGAYGSSDNDTKMQEHTINHIQTAVRGRTPGVAIEIKETKPERHRVSCPLQITQSKKTRKRYKACFDMTICARCPYAQECQTIKQKKRRVFYFDEEMVHLQKRIHAIEQLPVERQKIRPNIEATVKEYTKAYNHKGKLKVRGSFKTILFAFAMSIGINFGRIYRYILENPYLSPGFNHDKSIPEALVNAFCKETGRFLKCLELFVPKFQRTVFKLPICLLV